jgi:hypothetical protein
VFWIVKTPFPGSTRSGAYPRKKSLPTFAPVRSRIGCTISSVVPGYVVDWSTISWPARRFAATDSAAETMYWTSGVRVFESGVGTQIVSASRSRTTE